MQTQNDTPASLESPDGESSPVRPDDLEPYRQLLKDAESFQTSPQPDPAADDFQQLLLYHVLDHTQFLNSELLSVVEHYKRNLHILASLDFVGPMTALRSAEKEIDSMSTSGVDHTARLAHLQETVALQKQRLSELKKNWVFLTSELRRLALMLYDHLSAMERTCNASIAILSDCEVAKNRERQKIEDIKKHYRNQLKYNMYSSRITWRDLENAKVEFDLLSREISILGKEEITSLAELYTSFRDRVRTARNEIDALLPEIEGKKNESVKDNKDLFRRLGRTLVSFLSDRRFGLKTPEIREAAADAGIIRAARKELLGYLFDVVRQERRARQERRVLPDRRTARNVKYKGIDRRSGRDRRAANRRKIL